MDVLWHEPVSVKIETILEGRTLVTFFTSFAYPVQIEDADVDMLQSVLQQIDLSKGLVLMISSPGGDGLAAERIVNVCKAYSGTVRADRSGCAHARHGTPDTPPLRRIAA